MFGKKERLVTLSTPDGLIEVNKVAFDEIMRLKEELRAIKFENATLKRELELIKPALEDKRITPPASKACEDCKFSVLSPWNRQVIGCRKNALCDDFSKREDN